MTISEMIKLALSLISKREEIGTIISDALALFKKVQSTLPDLTKTLEGITKGKTEEYSVEWLQKSLNELVNAGITVDGKYGPSTHDAVKKFQASHGLEADGWAGALTQAALIEALGK